MAYVDRSYPWDVSVVELADNAGANTYHYGPIYENAALESTMEIEESWAATDRTNRSGIPFATHKARSWNVRLGAFVANPGTGMGGAASLKYGWNLSALTVVATDLLPYFKVARVNLRATTVEARAVMDTATEFDATGSGKGWRYPLIQKREITVDLESVVPVGGPRLFEGGLGGSLYQAAGTITLQGGPWTTITGNVIVASTTLDDGPDESNDKISLRFIANPTITPAAGYENGFLNRALDFLPFTLSMTRRPLSGATTYGGKAIFTEASFEAPDGACKQGATLTGYGSLRVI